MHMLTMMVNLLPQVFLKVTMATDIALADHDSTNDGKNGSKDVHVYDGLHDGQSH